MARRGIDSRRSLTLVFLIIAGILLGGFIGNLTEGITYLDWLNYGFRLGMKSPLELDFKMIYMQFQLLLDVNIASFVGIALAVYIYRKL